MIIESEKDMRSATRCRVSCSCFTLAFPEFGDTFLLQAAI
jgi:hypothetical protein